MEAYDEKKSAEPFVILLILLFMVVLVGVGFVFDVFAPLKHTNKAPDVSVESGRVYIFKDRNCEYMLVASYVFSNKGKKPISFDTCYDVSAQMNGTACPKCVPEDEVDATVEEIAPGRIVGIEVVFALKDYVPGKSADVSVKLYDRFDNQKLLLQEDRNTVNLAVKEKNPFCGIC